MFEVFSSSPLFMLGRWVRLAAQCLTELRQTGEAARLHALVGNFKKARDLLASFVGGSEPRLLADICQQASDYYFTLAKASQVRPPD